MWRNSKNYGFSRPATHPVLLRGSVISALIVTLISLATALPAAANVLPRAAERELTAPVVQVSAAKSCPRNSMMAEDSGVAPARDALNALLFTTTLHVVWCYHNVVNGKVTRVTKITVTPNLTTLGAVGGWEYLGLVPGTSDDYYYNASGAPDSGYHVFREAHWRVCLIHIGCVRDAYFKMNMNVFYNGKAVYYNGPDKL